MAFDRLPTTASDRVRTRSEAVVGHPDLLYWIEEMLGSSDAFGKQRAPRVGEFSLGGVRNFAIYWKKRKMFWVRTPPTGLEPAIFGFPLLQ